MGSEFICDLSACVTIVTVFLSPFSAGVLVRRAIAKLAGDIRMCEDRVLLSP